MKHRSSGGLLRVAGCMVAPLMSGLMCPSPSSDGVVHGPVELEPARWVTLDGAINTRDLGGYATTDGRRIKWNVLYRSANLASLTEEGCAALERLGIRTVIDLRNRLSPMPLFGGDVACVHRQARVLLFPILISKNGGVDDGYRLSVQEYARSYANVFEQLSVASNYPVLYHCAAGKDRSGIVSVLLLLMLGVDRETALSDYHLSLEVYDALPTDAMLRLLDDVDAAGGIEPYLEGIGVTAENQARIRDLLLERVEL